MGFQIQLNPGWFHSLVVVVVIADVVAVVVVVVVVVVVSGIPKSITEVHIGRFRFLVVVVVVVVAAVGVAVVHGIADSTPSRTVTFLCCCYPCCCWFCCWCDPRFQTKTPSLSVV